jgi:glycine cleavage system transcriptional repressor
VEQKFIMTAFGKDRPGIVAEIARIIYENKCNLEDSSMGRLADEFTLILLLAGAGEKLQEKLSRACQRLEMEKEIFAFVRPLDYHPAKTNGKSNTCLIKVEGVDQAGIVYKISRFLGDQGINIESLKSRKKFSPNSGTAMYSMEILVALPDDMAVKSLSENLENIGHELHVDIDIR